VTASSGAPLVAVLDYGIGNLRSAEKALRRAGADARLVTEAADARRADGVVLPGVGAFGACMDALRGSGLESAAREGVESGRPFLGICVGMQMLFDASDESPDSRGLGVIPGRVRWIEGDVKRPQMQWNRLLPCSDDPMFAGLGDEPWVYFVHSLHGVPADESMVVARCDYGGAVNAAFRNGNVFATQFHPEKSGKSGLALLGNFVKAIADAR